MISGFSNKLRIVTTHAEGSRVELAYGEHPRPAHVPVGSREALCNKRQGLFPTRLAPAYLPGVGGKLFF